MRVSDFFKLSKTQPYLDFVDVTLDTDVSAFVDPSAIKSLQSDWAHQCTSLLQGYFEGVLRCILDGNDEEARGYLSCLNERNEFHLGFSRGESRGHAFGKKSADSVWQALSRSKAAKSGLLEDLEDTALLIEGVGKDMISDAVCNIIRGPLIEYTQNVCREYGIPLTPDVPSGSVWNSTSRTFSSFYTELPITNSGPVILVPKILVRYDIAYRYDEYYAHYLLPEMQRDEIAKSSSLVHLLKNGKRRVTKKSLRERYGSSKSSVAEQTVRFPDVLSRYRTDKKAKTPEPLTHLDLVMIGGAAIPDYDGLLTQLRDIPVGRDGAYAYESLIEQILSAALYPSLVYPTKQFPIHDGRKRIDITYCNEARGGFFHWLQSHYASSLIFVECKNYGKEIGNPDLDQLAGRFSINRGKVGILICRNIKDADKLANSCRDTANDGRGFIITLTDDDLLALIREAKAAVGWTCDYSVLRKKFLALIS